MKCGNARNCKTFVQIQINLAWRARVWEDGGCLRSGSRGRSNCKENFHLKSSGATGHWPGQRQSSVIDSIEVCKTFYGSL